MKPAGYLLLIPTGLATLGEAATGLVSAELKAHVREGLPAYRTPAASPSAGSAQPPIFSETHADTDPNLLVLPKLTVKEKRLPEDAADHLMKRSDFKRKMENLYLDDVAAKGTLNYLLNSFTIPILSPSKYERGKALYIRRELERLTRVQDLPAESSPAKK